jgi:hypothetical protein
MFQVEGQSCELRRTDIKIATESIRKWRETGIDLGGPQKIHPPATSPTQKTNTNQHKQEMKSDEVRSNQ